MARDIRYPLRRLLLAADVLAGLAAAALVVAGFLAPSLFGPVAEGSLTVRLHESTPATMVFWLALMLLLANLLYFLYGRPPRQPLVHVHSDAPGGVVKVARDALETGLRLAGEAVPEVTRLRVAIEHGGSKRVRVKAQFQAPEGVPIGDASRKLREALSARFQQMVRLTDGNRVEYEIEFVGVSGKLAKKAEAAPEEPPPFTGPQYPIDDEDPFEGRKVS
jgi:hypothetical protein